MPKVYGRYVELRHRSSPKREETPPLVIWDGNKPFIVIEDGPDEGTLEELLAIARERDARKLPRKTPAYPSGRVRCKRSLISPSGISYLCGCWSEVGSLYCPKHRDPSPVLQLLEAV